MSHTQNLSKSQTTLYRSLKQSKFRKQEGLFLLEGVRLCEEAFNSDLKLVACITAKNFETLSIPDAIPQFEASSTQIQQISDHPNPQGIILVAKIPEPQALPAPKQGSILVAVDRISDPGNLGTILRTALWFGVTDILLGPDCVDPYNPKVVRASMGAIAGMNLHFTDNLVTSSREWKTANGEIAALHMSGTDLGKYQPEKGLFLIIGSEAHGVSDQLLSVSTSLSINKIGQGESLNAAMALGIALYELSKD
ncbi:MAG: RNA methyltransferase [Candidatus Marinimicrobia bacterium]|nr:RNA methyltransferase [Candidatus Neomarinimicrobiota bacterium]